MRSTNEILCDVKDNIPVSYEEMRMALLVLDSINYFNHSHLRRFCQGGIAAELTLKEFPAEHGDLGISKHEWNALRMDPIQYLGQDHIPGTPEWERFHKIHNNILKKITESPKHMLKSTESSTNIEG